MTRFGFTLSNRGIITGATTVPEMLHLAERVDRDLVWDSVWVGDSIFAKPRLDAISLLAAVAVKTERVRLGPACFASTPLRGALLLAYQWASLDFMSGGRTIFVACQGAQGGGHGAFEQEFAAFGVDPKTRMKRMEEAIEVLRLTSAREDASYEGTYVRFEHLTILPRPVQKPIPIWVTANPDVFETEAPDPKRLPGAERALRRVARLGDGWMTTLNTPESFRRQLERIRGYAREIGRELGPGFEACLYYNINVNDDREAAMEESRRYLTAYYGMPYSRELLERWVAFGSVADCVAKLRAFVAAGATTITLRLTSYDQERQYRRVTGEVLPALLA